MMAIFKLRAVPSRIILPQVETAHSVAEFMALESTTTDSSIIALNSAPTGPDFTGGARTPVDGLQYYW